MSLTRPPSPDSMHGGTVVVRLTAALCGPVAREAREQLTQALAGKPKRLVADLSAVTAMDATGVGALLAAWLWASKIGTAFAVLPSPTVRDVLTTSKMDRYCTLTEEL